jgi:formamidopyrimidine-DNA glycosylase
MFGNHLYMCVDLWHCYIQTLGLDEHPLEKSLLADVHEWIATFLMEQMIIAGGKFYADDAVWAEIMYGD